MKKMTVSDLIDYLGQFKPETQVVLSLDDFGADATEEEIDGAVSLTSAFEEFES